MPGPTAPKFGNRDTRGTHEHDEAICGITIFSMGQADATIGFALRANPATPCLA